MINALRGMKDIIFPDNEKYLYFIEKCSKIALNYGFEFINAPILEETALFKRSVGESSDIVGKEMYQFVDKGDNDVCLRPEGTAGIVRSFIQNKMDRAGVVKRFFYYGPMFRYERPQKGRLRQFHQFGIESFGVSDMREDAMVILMLNEILSSLGVKTTLKLNSLGCKKCMPSYRIKLVKFLDTLDGLCEDCQKRKKLNPIRTLDCKNDACQELLKNAPLLTNELCDECKKDFDELKLTLLRHNIDYEIDPKLVRGLDYYSKTAFEFVSDNIGAKSSVAGGGRYDGLVEFLGGKPTAAVGFAIGIERILELIQMPNTSKNGVYIGALCKEAENLTFDIGIKLCKYIKTDFEYSSKSFVKHLNKADKIGAKYFICIGENELQTSRVIVKNLESKEEKECKIGDLGGFQW